MIRWRILVRFSLDSYNTKMIVILVSFSIVLQRGRSTASIMSEGIYFYPSFLLLFFFFLVFIYIMEIKGDKMENISQVWTSNSKMNVILPSFSIVKPIDFALH